jgi:hypothetical protein
MVELAIGPLRVRNGQTLIAQSRTRRLRSLSLLEPHPGAAAILGDELDAGDRKSCADHCKGGVVRGCQIRLEC